MTQALSVAGFVVAALAGLYYAWRRISLNQLIQDRAFEDVDAPETAGYERPIMRRHYVIPWMVALTAGLLIHFVIGWHAMFAGALAFIIGLLGVQVDEFFYTWRVGKLEAQLADSIDLMVGSLGAGAGAMAAIESAAIETRKPLRPLLEEALARIRYGDDARTVFRALSMQVPLETYLLFCSTLSVHWEVGGSLAPVLATLGRTIRDRIEIARKINSNIVQSQVSTVIVLGVSYFIALLMWYHDEGSMEGFVTNTTGRNMIAITMVLQGIGIAWMAAMSKMKF